MQRQSITIRLISVITLVFLVTAGLVILTANHHLRSIIDRSQTEVYQEKLDTIISSMTRKHQLLLDTLWVEHYEKGIQESYVKAFYHDYYNESEIQPIYPVIINREDRKLVLPDAPTVVSWHPTLIDVIVNCQNGAMDYHLQGRQYWIVSRTFPQWNWTVAYVVPHAVKYADVRLFSRNLVIIMATMILIALLTLILMVTRHTRPIEHLTEAATCIAAGNLEESITIRGIGEVKTLAESFHTMREAICRKMTEQRQAQERLLEYQQRLRSLASELSLAEERQRRHLASCLHDSACQNLALIKMHLQSLALSLPVSLRPQVQDLCTGITDTMDELRSLTFDLSPPALYIAGLKAGIEEWLEKILRDKHGIAYELQIDSLIEPMSNDLRTLLFQSVRELLINTIKHAQAKKVHVVVSSTVTCISIMVQDDGIGFDVNEIENSISRSGGFGLFNVRERLEFIGGCLSMHSEPGHGSTFVLTAPIPIESKYDMDITSEKSDKNTDTPSQAVVLPNGLIPQQP